MKVLIACEESQRVCTEFRKLGHEAYSCDITEPSGNHPEWHVKGDVLHILDGNCTFKTIDGHTHTVETWDLIIAHPPCTYLSNAGARWLYADGKLNQERYKKGLAGKEFFMKFYNANCKRVAIENPIPSTVYNMPPYTQIIQPYEFGEPWSKKTCLWLKGLDCLKPTNIVTEHKPYCSSGSYSGTHDPKFKGASRKGGSAKTRSKTFVGIAKAMAQQWGAEQTKECDKKVNLYELTGQWLELQDMLNDPESDLEAVIGSIEALDGEIEVKADGYAKMIRNLDGNLISVIAEMERLKTRKNMYEASIKWLKKSLQGAMVATGKRNFKTALFTFTVKKAGGKDPVIMDISDTSELPDELVKIEEKPDLDAIRELIQKNGSCKYAHLGQRQDVLVIK